jgi:hypothetical protein
MCSSQQSRRSGKKKERQDETQFTTKIDGPVRTFLGHSEAAPTSAPSRMDDDM